MRKDQSEIVIAKQVSSSTRKPFSLNQDSHRTVVRYILASIMKSDDLPELISINEISMHAQYFLAACLMQGIDAAARKLDVNPKTITNHIKWLQRLEGKILLKYSPPGKCMKLSAHGEKLAQQLIDDFQKAVKNLYANKMDGVVGGKLTQVIKSPFVSKP